MHKEGIKTYSLDGDNIRKGVNQDLSFSPEDRTENIRRIAEISKLLVDAGLVVLAAFIAPFSRDRNFVRNTVGKDNYVEVYVSTSLEKCEELDVKGLYKRARKGEIPNMTGINSPYEIPVKPDVTVSQDISIEESVAQIMNRIERNVRLK